MRQDGTKSEEVPVNNLDIHGKLWEQGRHKNTVISNRNESVLEEQSSFFIFVAFLFRVFVWHALTRGLLRATCRVKTPKYAKQWAICSTCDTEYSG